MFAVFPGDGERQSDADAMFPLAGIPGQGYLGFESDKESVVQQGTQAPAGAVLPCQIQDESDYRNLYWKSQSG